MHASLIQRRFNPLAKAAFAASLLLVAGNALLQARTLLESHPTRKEKETVSATFHREFVASDVKPGEDLLMFIRAGDGAVIRLNGEEVGRANMPAGTVEAGTLALKATGGAAKTEPVRLQVPAHAVHPGEKNLVEAEVHSATSTGARLTFDLQVKTFTVDAPASAPVAEAKKVAVPVPPPSAEAKKVLEAFRRDNYIAPGTTIPDGYFDGGRHMKLDAQAHASSGREILVVDRPHDPELAKDIAFARTLRELPPMERARKLSLYIDEISTPPEGRQNLEKAVQTMETQYRNKPLRIGEMVEQAHAGVCRHRSLLFKLMGDEAGLKTALVRGNYVHLHAGGSGAHAWNEIKLDDGRRYLVDTTLHPKDPFPEITTPAVTPADIPKRYVKDDGSHFY